MSNKLGRNELCWCGSGKKYKHCHRERQEQPAIPIETVNSTYKKAYSKKYCLHPNASPSICSGGIVKAHTIQRNGGLNKIARNGHVYGYAASFGDMIKNNGKISMKLIGVNNASTFTGFCSLHDTSLFAPIETHPFQSNEEHTFLLGFRAIAREFFAKKGQSELVDFQRSLDKGKGIEDQFAIQYTTSLQEIGVNTGLRDIQSHKKAFDDVLVQQNFSSVKYYIVRLDRTPNFLCSGVTYVTVDFEGNVLQDLFQLKDKMDIITFSLIPTDSGGAAVFTWIGENNKSKDLVSSLDAKLDNDIPNALVRFAFQYFENIFVSPDWWEGLSSRNKRKILKRVNQGVHPFREVPVDCLKDDGISSVNWVVTSRETNVSL